MKGRANTPGGRGNERNGGLRGAIERRSAVPMVFLERLPRWMLLAPILVALVIGMTGTGWVGASGFLVLWVVLAWFAYLGWPSLDLRGRMLRLAALAVIAAIITTGVT